ncbi:hypothetical protein B0I37DRAFT_125886 [Chaetomium sp. MPI-CAGE-AT-0009]|nr:hypothetical protein B0I37DRAFT_125886 [Chaetomium sp. MPI-CAGE-AT-0009]
MSCFVMLLWCYAPGVVCSTGGKGGGLAGQLTMCLAPAALGGAGAGLFPPPGGPDKCLPPSESRERPEGRYIDMIGRPF